MSIDVNGTIERLCSALCSVKESRHSENFFNELSVKLRSSDCKKSGVNDYGEPIAFKELARVALIGDEALTLLKRRLWKTANLTPLTEINQFIRGFFGELINYLIDDDFSTVEDLFSKPLQETFELVVFENGALMILPKKETADLKVCGFNPGWGVPTETNLKTVCGAACAVYFNHRSFDLYDGYTHADNDALAVAYQAAMQEYSDLYYKVRDACSSLEFDSRAYFQLVD